jgi:hypothetical protein
MDRHNATKKIDKILSIYSRKHGWYSGFTHLLDYLVYVFSHGHIIPDYFNNLDEEDGKLMAQMYLAFGDQEPFEDVLGDLYEEIAGRGHKSAMGQFFTPMNLCDAMAMMIINEKKEGVINAMEPCSGSGRNVLAAEKQFRKIGQQSRWTCVELDITCVKMTLINMCINSIQGDIIHGNCLSGVRFGVYNIQVINRVPVLLEYPKTFADNIADSVIGIPPDRRKKMPQMVGSLGLEVTPQQETTIKKQEKKIDKRTKILESEDKGGDQLPLF